MTDENSPRKFASWNWRLTVRTCDDETLWELREICYDDQGNVTGWSKDPASAVGSSWMECADELAKMAGVVGFPALDLDTGQWCDHRRRPKNSERS